MNFLEWLLSESDDIKIAPDIKSIPMEIKSGGDPIKSMEGSDLVNFIKKSLKYYFGNYYKQAMDRYSITLDSINNYGDSIHFNYDIDPKGRGVPEIADKDNPMYDYLSTRNYRTGYKLFKTPKDAIEQIPHDPNLGYRGMSWEEWQLINKRGFIQSFGDYNITGQEHLTFYGDASSATYYASGFAPMQFQTSLKKPSVVIAVPRSNLMTHQDRPNQIPDSEMAHQGPLSAKEIVGAWMLAPTKSKKGSFTLIHSWTGIKNEEGNYTGRYTLSHPKEGSRFSPSIQYTIRKLK